MSVVADTSIWVEYLRGGRRAGTSTLDDLLEAGEIVLCGPVCAELLAGASAEQRDELAELFASLPWADLDREGWRTVGEVAARLRQNGESVPLTDIAIAAAAVAHGAAVWTRDSDFRRIAGALTELDLYDAA